MWDGRGREAIGNKQWMEGPNDATQQPTNGGGLNERQRRWLRGGDRQTGNTTTNYWVGGDGVVVIKCRGADWDAEGVKQATLQPTNWEGGGWLQMLDAEWQMVVSLYRIRPNGNRQYPEGFIRDLSSVGHGSLVPPPTVHLVVCPNPQCQSLVR